MKDGNPKQSPPPRTGRSAPVCRLRAPGIFVRLSVQFFPFGVVRPNYRSHNPTRLSEAYGKSFLLRYWRSNRERAGLNRLSVHSRKDRSRLDGVS